MFKTRFKALQTSVPDSQELSLTIKGALATLVLFMTMLGYKDIIDVNATTDAIVQFILLGSQMITLCITIYGLFRKIYNNLTNK